MKTRKPVYFAILSIVGVLALRAAPASAPTDYRIGPQDVLGVDVYPQTELSREARVAADGTLSLPGIASLEVTGLSEAGLAKKLQILWVENEYLIGPHVAVSVVEYNSSPVLVLGQVRIPGLYRLKHETNLLEIISEAGGFTLNVGRKIILVRTSHGPDGGSSQEAIPIDLDLLLKEGDTSQNIPLRKGDALYVLASSEQKIYISGEVAHPGSYALEGEVSVLKAITMAGGFTPVAAGGKVKIIRSGKKGEKTFRVNVARMLKTGDRNRDIALQPGDIIVVPRSIF